jgi:REP element-mobilizing transposase RayT
LRSVTFYKRNLPHWQPENAALFVTWRLYGSLPRAAIARINSTRRLFERETARGQETTAQLKVRQGKRLFALLDELLDKAESGPTWLEQEPIASVVEDALLTRYAHLHSLWAYVIMPNHVHVLIRPKVAQASACGSLDSNTLEPQAEACATSPTRLSDITQRLKGYTSRGANRILNRTGHPFWQTESFDHWARDEAELHRIIAYIEENPVTAGLCANPEDWRWSSARQRRARGWTELHALT